MIEAKWVDILLELVDIHVNAHVKIEQTREEDNTWKEGEQIKEAEEDTLQEKAEKSLLKLQGKIMFALTSVLRGNPLAHLVFHAQG